MLDRRAHLDQLEEPVPQVLLGNPELPASPGLLDLQESTEEQDLKGQLELPVNPGH